MDAAFWHARWQNNELGFHMDSAHPLLQQCLPAFLPATGKVLVPLCGKSPDLSLLAQAMPVVGAELSEIACDDFFREQQLACTKQPQGDFMCYQAANITLLQGDFFALETSQLSECTFAYDRAALIALPPEMRLRYVAKLRQVLPSAARILLIGLSYPQQEKQGPPFSVPEQEVRQLFAGCEITVLAIHDITGQGFAKRRFATSSLLETAYSITLP